MAWPPTTHQDVEDDLTNGHGWASSLIERFRIGELLVPTGGLLWVAGRYYGSNSFGTSATGAMAANRLFLTPFYAPRPRTIDRIGINVTTAAGTSARLGIYNSNATTGLPTTVALDAGTLSTSTTGAKEATVSATLHGLVWLAAVADSAVTVTSFSSSSLTSIVGATTVNATAVFTIGKDSVPPASALPDLTGLSFSYGSTSTPPAVLVRAA